MLAKAIVTAVLLAFSLNVYSQDESIKLSGFECADNYSDALKWLGFIDAYIVKGLQTELLKLQPDATVYAVKCKSEPFYTSRPYTKDNKILAGKTQEVSLSFSFSMAVMMAPERDRTLHIDMTYSGEKKADSNKITIQRNFSIVGNVKTKIE